MTHPPIPGYRPIDQPPPGPDTPRRVDGVAKVLIGVLIGAAVTSIASGVASLYRGAAIEDQLAGEGSVSAINRADLTLGIVAIADVLVYVAGIVFFFIWSWRVFKNAKLLSPDQAPAAGWAIGAWCIPIANFVLPAYFISKADRVSGTRPPSAKPLIIGWAILFWVAQLADRVIWRGTDLDSLREVAIADRRDIWQQLIYAAAAGVAILMIRAITARQERAFVERTEQQRQAVHDREAWARSPKPQGYSAPIDPSVGHDLPRPPAGPPPPADPGPGLRGPG